MGSCASVRRDVTLCLTPTLIRRECIVVPFSHHVEHVEHNNDNCARSERKKSLEDRQRKLDHREAQLAAEKESQTEKKARRAQMERRLEKLSKGLEGLSAKTDKSLETTEELRGGLMTSLQSQLEEVRRQEA